jgi:ribokinase
VVDWVVQIPNFPKPDEKIDALTEDFFSGGVTANFLVAVARLGCSCGFIGAVGDDPYGEFVINDFKYEGVDVQFTIKKANKKTPVNFIFIAKGEKTIIQSPHMQTTKLEITDLNEIYIANSKLLHTTILHPELTKKAIEIAKENGVKVSIDLEPQIARRGWNNLKELILKADILLSNQGGAKTITQSKTAEEAAKILIKKGIPIVVITLGKKGAFFATKDIKKQIPSFNIEPVVDTTGAGDAFNGAFSVAFWIKKMGLEKAIRYANAAAALKIKKLGARTGMANEDELKNFLKKS